MGGRVACFLFGCVVLFSYWLVCICTLALASASRDVRLVMAVAKSFASWTYNDNTVNDKGKPESANFEVAIIPLTAGNVVATTGLVDALTTAIEAIVLGNLAKTTVVWEREEVSSAAAALQSAQRETKLLLRYHGSTSNTDGRTLIPTFDVTQLPNHSEFLDLTDGVGADLKTAFEAVVRMRGDGSEAVILDSAQFV